MITKTKAYLIILITALSAMLLSSCKKGVYLLIFNNSGTDVIVTRFDAVDHSDLHKIARGANKPVPWPSRLSIKAASNDWAYASFPLLPTSYVHRTSRGPDYLKLQLEPDGLLYVLSSSANGLLTNFPSQPQGF